MLSTAALDNLTKYISGCDKAGVKEVMSFILDTMAKPNGAADLEDAFYKDLEFGTGGLRGIMGPGSNRMNEQVVARATQGLVTYVKKVLGTNGGIVIAYDCRLNSKEFAHMAARVIAGNGLKAYLFSEMRPTPELSFAVRHLRASAGIVVTASHNPKEYNGYKVSWSDGAQVIPPNDAGIIAEVRAVDTVQMVDFDAAVKDGSIVMVDSSMDKAFLEAADTALIRKDLIKEKGGGLKIVYTPLHGTGITVVPTALARCGFTSVLCEPSQSIPDGTFPTTKSPNPEEREALSLALELAEKEKADLVIATDPDTDRVGTAVRHNGEMRLISGNQMCALMVWYMCNSLRVSGKMPPRPGVISTIVTSRLPKHIAESYKVDVKLCLTGFKWIASVMRDYELHAMPDGSPKFNVLMGFEESYGYLIGTFVRDKDAVTATMLIAEMALWCKQENMTLIDLLERIYCEYGVHLESTVSVSMPGKTGMEKITRLMAALRSEPPASLAGLQVVRIDDIEKDETKNVIGGGIVTKGPGLPKSSVLGFYLSDGSLVYVRPSGTEPKIKFYIMVADYDDVPFKAEALPERVKKCEEKLTALTNDFRAFAAKFED